MTKRPPKTVDISPIAADIVIIDTDDEEEYNCKGRYYGDGRILVDYKGHWLGVDPECYHSQDPKLLFIVKNGKWSRFRIRSVIIDSKAIRKKQNR